MSVESVLQKNKIYLFTGDNRKPTRTNKTGVSNRRKLGTGDGRAKGVANVIHAVDSIGNGKFKAHEGVRFVFGNPGRSSRVSRRTMYDIQLNPGGQNISGVGSRDYGGTHNRALIAHELGHYVGRLLYNRYFAAVKGKCFITGYADDNRNEEFAEVFAAYITNPALFAGKSKNCGKAFTFLAKEFGETNIGKSCESRLRSLENARKTVSSLDLNRIPIPSPRPDIELIENYQNLPIPIERPVEALSIEVSENSSEESVNLDYDSDTIEKYYTEAFADHGLFEQVEEETDESDDEDNAYNGFNP